MTEIVLQTLYLPTAEMIISECETALKAISLAETAELINAVEKADNVFFIGVGRVLLSLKSIAKRWAHLGIQTHIVGDITEPAITENDILIVGSGSGESLIPVAIAQKAVALGAKVVYIGSNLQSTIAHLAAVRVRIPVKTKLNLPDEIDSLQPMTSLFEQTLLLYGDLIASIIVQEKDMDLNALWHTHANLE